MRRGVSFLTNIPNPYNGDLYAGLAEVGSAVSVRYKGDPTSEGRPWSLEMSANERVAPHIWDERDVLTTASPQTLVLTGSWATPRDAARRLAALAARRRGSKVVVWGEPMSNRGGVRGRLRHLYFNPMGLDAILGIGSHAVRSYRAATGGGVPIHVFPYTTNSGLAVERDRASRPVVGFAGRLIDWKGAHLLIWALHHIPASDRPAFEIVGSGPLEGQLRRLACRLEVDVTFHGEVAKPTLELIRSRWWLALVPSQEVDGWGLVVPEAMNSAVPVVASGFVGSGVDMVRDGLNGMLVHRDRASDPRAWADAIERTLALDQEEASANARAVGDAFSARRAAPWLQDLLSDDLSVEQSFVNDAWSLLGAPRA